YRTKILMEVFMIFHDVFVSTDPHKSSAVRSLRCRIHLLKRAGELAEQTGQSVNMVLNRAIEAGLPAIEGEAQNEPRS
ncbi:MAG: hypothetical protein KDJ52_30065, partial [Anaerolineae bacterium]|nr:hypothetical protein [Anaerolineae bacterium]